MKRIKDNSLILNNNFLFTDQFHKLGNEADFFNSFMYNRINNTNYL